MREYDRQHGVTESWSKVAEASRRYSAQTGDSEMASLDESLSANLTRMRSFQERASLARQESESWSEQAAQVRSDAQAIERELGQPFFAWLSERTGADGRAIGAAGAMRIASPQTPEDAEALREHAAAFIAEKIPGAGGTRSGDRSAARRSTARRATRSRTPMPARPPRLTGAGRKGCGIGRACAGRAPAGRDRGRRRCGERAETETGMIVRGAARGARMEITRGDAREGRARVAVEEGRPFEEHATENLPFIGGWLAGQLFGTAKNAAPDGDGAGGENAGGVPDRKDWGDSSP